MTGEFVFFYHFAKLYYRLKNFQIWQSTALWHGGSSLDHRDPRGKVAANGPLQGVGPTTTYRRGPRR
jgi:hypothetical protein